MTILATLLGAALIAAPYSTSFNSCSTRAGKARSLVP